MQLSWLDRQDSWLIVPLLLVTMLLAAKVACRLGRAMTVAAGKGSDDTTRAVINLAASHTRRLSALVNRVPDSVIWMLLGAAAIGMAEIGYSAGLGNHQGMPACIVLCVLVCGSIYIVLDLDRPPPGVMQVDQVPMIRLQQVIDHDPETGATP